MNSQDELNTTIKALVQDRKGILAADESVPTISKRFKAVGIESTEETRRAYRELLLTAPGIGEFISGVILFEETLGQKAADGTLLIEVAQRAGIVPGIKVDKGTIALANAPGDMVTQGLDGLAERLAHYKIQGARFAKWREIYPITPTNPTRLGMTANAEVLARYAAICQEQGIVPIVEPEVLIDGEHSIERCAEVTEAVLSEVFTALCRHRVSLERMLLKPNMIVPGKAHQPKSPAHDVARMTIEVFRRVVPAAVPSINFLSGGLSPEDASSYLNAMNALYPHAPWALSFSYARALQEPAMAAWRGLAENVGAAQHAFCERARCNSAARCGQYGDAIQPPVTKGVAPLPELDENGLLKDPGTWNESVASALAAQSGLGELTEDHWKIIRALREYYGKFGVAPAMNQVCHAYGRDWRWAHDLFHTCLGAWRVAGLPDPGEEAKSYLNDM